MAEEADEGEGGELPSRSSFSLVHEKLLPSKTSVAAWSPDKDVLALALADGQLSVHRHNWQRLWVAHPASEVTSLCWRPDGKLLAVGHKDGSMALMDLENGAVRSTTAVHQEAVVCMEWTECAGAKAVRDLQVDPTTCVLSGIPGNDEKQIRIGNASCVKVSLSPDMCRLAVVCHGTPSPLFTQSSSTSGLLYLSFPTTAIADRSREIRQVATQGWQISELLERRSVLDLMEARWGDAMRAFTARVRELSDLLVSHGSHLGPREELLSLLACGTASPALHQFLASSLGEAALKRLGRSMEGAMHFLHTQLTEQLQAVMEELVFRLGELRGLARWRARMLPLGIEESLVWAAVEEGGMSLVQLERLLRLNAHVAAQFRVLFEWLLAELRNLNEGGGAEGGRVEGLPAVSTAVVAEFLGSTFQDDPIGPQLASAAGSEAIQLAGYEEEAAADMAAVGGFTTPNFLQRSMRQQLEALNKACTAVFSGPLQTLSPLLRPSALIQLAPTAAPLSPFAICQAAPPTPSARWGLVMAFPAAGGVGLLRHSERLEAVGLRVEEEYALVDMAQYRADCLGLLLNREDASGSVLMLVRLGELEWREVEGGRTAGAISEWCQERGCVGALRPADERHRVFRKLKASPPLALSGPRGLGCVCGGSTGRRISVLDLVEDESLE